MSRPVGGVGSNQYQTRGSATQLPRAATSVSPNDVAWAFHPDRQAWADGGLGLWSEAGPWHEAGFAADEAVGWRAGGLGPQAAQTVLREAGIGDRGMTGTRFHRFLRNGFKKLPEGPRAAVEALRILMPADKAEALVIAAWLSHVTETYPDTDLVYQQRMITKAVAYGGDTPDVNRWWNKFAPVGTPTSDPR